MLPLNFLSYNGVLMSLVKLHFWSRKAVYNANQYLYTRHLISITGVLNPAVQPTTTELRFNPNAQIVNAAFNGLDTLQLVKVNNLGVVTDTKIRHYLMQPRRQLAYSIYGYPLLFSPWTGFRSDSTGGPMPIEASVVSLKGAKTVYINFTIQTDINECITSSPGRFPLLSHTWTMDQQLDEDVFTTRVIQGRAVFDRGGLDRYADEMRATILRQGIKAAAAADVAAQQQQANMLNPGNQAPQFENIQRAIDIDIALGGGANLPQFIAERNKIARDMFDAGQRARRNVLIDAQNTANGVTVVADMARQQLFHPLPANFKRMLVKTKLHADGATLDYIIVDRERALNINLPNVTRIQGIHTINVGFLGLSGLYKTTHDTMLQYMDDQVRHAQSIESTPVGAGPAGLQGPNPVAIIAAQAASVARVGINLAAGYLESAIPQVTHDISLRLWGNRLSSRAQLTKHALVLLANRLSLLPFDARQKLAQVGKDNIQALGKNFNNQLLPVPDALRDGFNKLMDGAQAGADAVAELVGNGDVLDIIGTVPAAIAGFSLRLTHSLEQKYVELHMQTLGSPFSSMFGVVPAIRMVFGDDDTGTSIQHNTWDGSQGWPGSDMSRGTFIEYMMAQGLIQGCFVPNSPNPVTNTELNTKNKLPQESTLNTRVPGILYDSATDPNAPLTRVII